MSDEIRPPEDELPGDADDGAWSWLDDAVDAWDDAFDAWDPATPEEPTDAPEGFDEAAEATGTDGADGLAELPEDGIDPAGADAGGGDDEPAHVDLPFPDDDTAAFVVPAADTAGATCSTAALAEALTLAGIDDAGAVLSGLDGDRVDARDAVGALDFAGVDARVEYAGLGELVERLAGGDEVLLGGGEPHALVAIDPAAGEVVVEPLAGGPRTVLAVELFEEAWDETANELMVLNADNPGIRLGGGEVCVIPVAVADIS